jgi:hypothetical protein
LENLKLKTYFASLAIVALFLSAPVFAVPVTSEFPGVTSPIIVPVLSTDLLQTSLAAQSVDSGSINGEGTTNLNVLHDGAFQSDNAFLLTPNTGAVVRLTFDTSVNTTGYDVSTINTYGGWNDSGRDRQTFLIEYSTVLAPSTFLSVDSVDFNPANVDGGDSASLAAFSVNLTNVAQLRFTFGTQENGHAGYGEFDVIGTASAPPPAPEPATATLIGLGILGLVQASRRRRRNSSATNFTTTTYDK